MKHIEVRPVGNLKLYLKENVAASLAVNPNCPKKMVMDFFCIIRRNKSGEYYKPVQQMISNGL